MTKTRSEKYKELRDTISFDTQVEKNKKALKDFEERLNKIDPHLMDTVGNDLSDFSSEPDLMDTSHSLRPFGNVSSGKTRPDSYSDGYSGPKNNTRLYGPEGSKAAQPYPAGKEMTKEEIKKEIKSLFQDDPVAENPMYEEDLEKTAPISKAARHRKPADYKKEEEKKASREDPLDNTRRLINIFLWLIIIVLAVILLVIVYLIFTQKPAGA